jgi:hypothetical protein
MQGSIAQIVALTTHGNFILQNPPNFQNWDFFLQNSTFRFCESVAFADARPHSLNRQEQAYAKSVKGWFDRLLNEGIYSLRMSYEPSAGNKIADRMLVGFVGGGGKWLIAAEGPDRKDFWESRWQVKDRSRADRRIWRVTYVRIQDDGKLLKRDHSADLEKLKADLCQGLKDIAAFSCAQNLNLFTKAFESGLARLESPTPLQGLYHTDITPTGFLPLTADQLLGAAEAAWVFGGMGSWNDMGFEGKTQTHYEEVSGRLYQLLNKVIVAAANSRSLP